MGRSVGWENDAGTESVEASDKQIVNVLNLQHRLKGMTCAPTCCVIVWKRYLKYSISWPANYNALGKLGNETSGRADAIAVEQH